MKDWESPSTGLSFAWIQDLGLWVSRYVVSNAMYREMVPQHDSGAYRGVSLSEDNQPVVMVSFEEAKAFCEWLSERDGLGSKGLRYRLPTDEEWLVYAQCGDDRIYPWGDTWPPPCGAAGNYAGEELCAEHPDHYVIAGYRDPYLFTAPVDAVWQNPWGLYGVGGNVYEYCATDKSGQFPACVRGGYHGMSREEEMRCSWRYIPGKWSGFRNRIFGFRLLLDERQI